MYWDKLIGGIDEAGRGSIIGPLLIAGISIMKSKIPKLLSIGVKDSKLLTPKARESLYQFIIDIADSICVYRIECDEIDKNVFFKNLNKMEAEVMAIVINNIQADPIYVDSCDVNPLRFKENIERRIALSRKLYCLHRADVLNGVVAAASIIAKVERDRALQEIRNIYPEIGSGYPSDSNTMNFIKMWIARYGQAPQFARKSWKPLKNMLQNYI